MTTSARSHPCSRPGDRAALVGVRQLGHPVQGLRQPRHAAHRRGEDRRRRDRCTGSPGLAPSVALHIPWDQVDDYGEARALRRASSASALGTINTNTFQDDDYKLGSLTHSRPADPAQGDRPPPRVHRHHGRDRLARPEDLAGRRHQLPRPGRPARPAGPAGRVARRDLRPARRRPAAGAGVQVLRAGVLPHRRPGLGHVVRPVRGPRRQGRGLPRHRPPRAGHQHRVHRDAAAAARASSAPSTSTPASTPTTT